MVPAQRVTGVDALLALETQGVLMKPTNPKASSQMRFSDQIPTMSSHAAISPPRDVGVNSSIVAAVKSTPSLPKILLKSEGTKKAAQFSRTVSISETDVDGDEESISSQRKKTRVKKQKKNKPKKAMTPFMVFSKETRKILVSENPSMTFSDIGKELGARWRNLAEENREIYKIKAGQDYQRFLDETEQLESLNPNRKRKTVEQKKQTKVKKSISAYLYFCNAHREQMKAIHPDMKMVEIQRLLADKWMNAPLSVKMPFEKQAEADREKFNSDMGLGIEMEFDMGIDEDDFLKLENDPDDHFYEHHNDDDEHFGRSDEVHNSDSITNLHEIFSLHPEKLA